MAAQTIPRSAVECVGHDSSRCGYCSRPNSARSFGVWAHRLDVRDYQKMLDAGWRRSGSYLYRPNLSETCCPAFVVRLEATRFVPSSSHKRVLKRLRRYSPTLHVSQNTATDRNSSPLIPLSDTSFVLKHPAADAHSTNSCSASMRSLERDRLLEIVRTAVANCARLGELGTILTDRIDDAVCACLKVYPPRTAVKNSARSPSPNKNKSATTAPIWCSNAAMVLASVERTAVSQFAISQVGGEAIGRSGKLQKNRSNSLNREKEIARQTALGKILSDEIQKHVTEYSITVTVPGFLNFYAVMTNVASDVDGDSDAVASMDVDTAHKQLAVVYARAKRARARRSAGAIAMVAKRTDGNGLHARLSDNERSNITILKAKLNEPTQKTGLMPTYFGVMNALMTDGAFSMEIVPAQFRLDAYEIFKRYQMSVHNEPPDQCGHDAYLRFLVDSPLINERVSPSVDVWYGTFHILYKLSGRLFAVGVVDLLPQCLSSVYLFYDPEFARLSPGTLSALKEIEWVRRGEPWYPSMRFYYMGFYIHSCPKMRYKISFQPSELLCEVTKNWIPTTTAKRVLDADFRGMRLAPEDMKASPEAAEFDLDDDEALRLANETKIGLDFSNETSKEQRIVSFRTLTRLLDPRCLDQLELIRNRLTFFVRQVGKSSAKFFMHVL